MKVNLELNISQLKAMHYSLPQVIRYVKNSKDRMQLFVIKLKVAEALENALKEQWRRKQDKP